MLPRRIIAIVGPTGSGKSRLAIDLARRFGGEIVNADAIQMYAGLDIASAKVAASEMRDVPHHMLSFLSPIEAFTVRDFHAMAQSCIADIAARGLLPIVVGGTMYYIQSLLRPSLLEEDELAAAAVSGGDGEEEGGEARAAREARGADDGASRALEACTPIAAAAAAAVDDAGSGRYTYERLCRVDAVMARRLHPNDTRKITRALEVFDASGMPYSEVLLRQRARLAASAPLPPATATLTSAAPTAVGSGACVCDGAPAAAAAASATPLAPLSPLCAHVIWTDVADRAVHDRALDTRVDAMLAGGLLDELARLRQFLALHAPTAAAAAAAAAVDASLPALSIVGLDASGAERPPMPPTSSPATALTLLALAQTRAARAGASASGAAPLLSPDARAGGDCRTGAGAAVIDAARSGGTADDGRAFHRAAAAASDGANALPCAPPPLTAVMVMRPPAAATLAAADEARGSALGLGLLQAIGCKEFDPYFAALELQQQRRAGGAAGAAAEAFSAEPGSVFSSLQPASKRFRRGSVEAAGAPPRTSSAAAASSAARDDDAMIAAVLARSVRVLRDATHRYVRVQARFIRNRFERRGVPMMRLDTSGAIAAAAAGSGGAAAWETLVAAPACESVASWLAAPALPVAPAAGEAAAAALSDASAGLARPRPAPDDGAALGDVERVFSWRKYSCAACGGRVFNGALEWEAHTASRAHASALASAARRERLALERGIHLPPRVLPRQRAIEAAAAAEAERLRLAGTGAEVA